MTKEEAVKYAKTLDIVEVARRYTTLHKESATEWAGPCPRCGGRDRFRVTSRGFFCRKCTEEPGAGGHWGDAIDLVRLATGCDFRSALMNLTAGVDIDPAEIDRAVQARAEREAQESRQAWLSMKAAQSELQKKRDWELYYVELYEYEKHTLWHQRGLSDNWIDTYKLGYCQNKIFIHEGRGYPCESLTIPYWKLDSEGHTQIISLRHRILTDDFPGGKYRPDIKGLGNHLFTPEPVMRMGGEVFLVEGEIKAMVTNTLLWNEDITERYHLNLSVHGFPGKSYKPEMMDQFVGCEHAYICVDPDTWEKPPQAGADWEPTAIRMKKHLEPLTPSTIIQLPEKIDDLIVAGALDRAGFSALLTK